MSPQELARHREQAERWSHGFVRADMALRGVTPLWAFVSAYSAAVFALTKALAGRETAARNAVRSLEAAVRVHAFEEGVVLWEKPEGD